MAASSVPDSAVGTGGDGLSGVATRASKAASPPEGLIYLPDFLDTGEESRLLKTVETLPFREVTMHGATARRTVIHFGWDYGYESWKISPADPLPEDFHHLRSRCADLISRHESELEQILIARYPPGAGIGWHRDAPMFGPEVVGVSLGAACTMRFRRKMAAGYEAWPQLLEPRSLYVLSGAARTEWQHMIPGARELRYSITFRSVKEGWKRRSSDVGPV